MSWSSIAFEKYQMFTTYQFLPFMKYAKDKVLNLSALRIEHAQRSPFVGSMTSDTKWTNSVCELLLPSVTTFQPTGSKNVRKKAKL